MQNIFFSCAPFGIGGGRHHALSCCMLADIKHLATHSSDGSALCTFMPCDARVIGRSHSGHGSCNFKSVEIKAPIVIASFLVDVKHLSSTSKKAGLAAYLS
eukprot:TRINITY_DN4594_c0_g1_i6.p1 TRINITY_DN4594_c0_g1~~TRINITY_DN4594_c0_g1_i6.p1  ORF type:complete len:101 (-),score=9.34 TRINITY_DN4594_c0_g1_i6:61-363(-)